MRLSAPVNAPRSWPNSSLSRIDSGSEPQLSLTSGPAARGLCLWICSATTSLPTPVSPSSSTVVSLCATRRTRSNTCAIAGSLTTTPGSSTSTGIPAIPRPGRLRDQDLGLTDVDRVPRRERHRFPPHGLAVEARAVAAAEIDELQRTVAAQDARVLARHLGIVDLDGRGRRSPQHDLGAVVDVDHLVPLRSAHDQVRAGMAARCLRAGFARRDGRVGTASGSSAGNQARSGVPYGATGQAGTRFARQAGAT